MSVHLKAKICSRKSNGARASEPRINGLNRLHGFFEELIFVVGARRWLVAIGKPASAGSDCDSQRNDEAALLMLAWKGRSGVAGVRCAVMIRGEPAACPYRFAGLHSSLKTSNFFSSTDHSALLLSPSTSIAVRSMFDVHSPVTIEIQKKSNRRAFSSAHALTIRRVSALFLLRMSSMSRNRSKSV